MKTIVLEMERLRNMNAGLGQYCLQLGRALAAEPAAQSYQFECYLPKELSGIMGAGFGYRATRKWHKLTGIQTGAALWHSTHQDTPYFPASKQTPVVMTIHDLNFMEREDYPMWRKKLKMRRLQQKIMRCKGLVYISEYVKKAAHQHLQLPLGVKEKVIYNGVESVEGKTVNKFQELTPYLFSIGLHPKKNYAVALPILQSKQEYRWVIAGANAGKYQEVLVQAAEKAGVGNRLVFTGAVSEAEKWSLYQNCAALIFPSLSEGFGLPVLEAMSFGKPVFLSNRTSLPEIGGGEAYYFNSFEAEDINQVFAKGMEDFKRDLEKPGRLKQHAAKFNWQIAAQQYLQFYHEILNN